MNNQILRLVASLLSGFLLSLATVKSLGIAQQCGYKNGGLLRWLKRKENMFFNRLCVLSLCLVLTTTCVSLAFSFLGGAEGLLMSAIPYMVCLLAFCYADERYALKVEATPTGRYKRLFAVYFLFLSCISYLFISVLGFLAVWNGSKLYRLISFAPFSVMPMLCPYILCLANGFLGFFENARNKKFVKRAKQVLDETNIIRVGVVGSYGKTSVKNILKTLLSEKYTVVETPQSYNTPVGMAKTILSDAFNGKQIFISEMGARKKGDIVELCSMVKPDYAIFTGVCEQHIQSFGSLEGVLAEKQEILRFTANKVVCGESLKGLINSENAIFADSANVKDVEYLPTETKFTLSLDGKERAVTTKLLGASGMENILLAATLALAMGLSAEEIAQAIEKIEPVPHRLQLIERGGVYILDDGYNCNPQGAKNAIEALQRFRGRKCIVTPGIVECGILEQDINEKLGEEIAKAGLDKVILVGETLVKFVKNGYENAEGDKEKLSVIADLERGKKLLSEWIQTGDAVLFLNDLPDAY